MPGVAAVLTGAEVRAISASLVVGVKAPMQCWPIAVDRVRYVGEPVAVVVASDRYVAEDALDLIDVRYTPLPAVVDPVAALSSDAPVLHEGLGGNLASDRSFRYGDPEAALAQAAHRVAVEIRYPRNACTPIETYGVVAKYDPNEDAYDVVANFQGPFSLHAVMARALKVPGNRLRLRNAARVQAAASASSRRVPLHRADRAGRPNCRPAGEVDRGSAGTSRRLGLAPPTA